MSKAADTMTNDRKILKLGWSIKMLFVHSCFRQNSFICFNKDVLITLPDFIYIYFRCEWLYLFLSRRLFLKLYHLVYILVFCAIRLVLPSALYEQLSSKNLAPRFAIFCPGKIAKVAFSCGFVFNWIPSKHFGSKWGIASFSRRAYTPLALSPMLTFCSQIVPCAARVVFRRSPTAAANGRRILPLGLLCLACLLGLPESYYCSSCTIWCGSKGAVPPGALPVASENS